MSQSNKINRNVIRKVNIQDQGNDFEYWQAQPFEYRLETLEKIRQEYIRWKYDSQPGFQRVYKVIKRS